MIPNIVVPTQKTTKICIKDSNNESKNTLMYPLFKRELIKSAEYFEI